MTASRRSKSDARDSTRRGPSEIEAPATHQQTLLLTLRFDPRREDEPRCWDLCALLEMCFEDISLDGWTEPQRISREPR
jgi:hypothetical protein